VLEFVRAYWAGLLVLGFLALLFVCTAMVAVSEWRRSSRLASTCAAFVALIFAGILSFFADPYVHWFIQVGEQQEIASAFGVQVEDPRGFPAEYIATRLNATPSARSDVRAVTERARRTWECSWTPRGRTIWGPAFVEENRLAEAYLFLSTDPGYGSLLTVWYDASGDVARAWGPGDESIPTVLDYMDCREIKRTGGSRASVQTKLQLEGSFNLADIAL
jgi:hypothetical protein